MRDASTVRLEAGGAVLRVSNASGPALADCLVSIRPEDVSLAPGHEAPTHETGNLVDAVLTRTLFHGDSYRLECTLPGGDRLLADIGRHDDVPQPGSAIRLRLPAERLRILPSERANHGP